ncbi:FadR/GntR family transcriptional regulator [Umezawaea tangerina]|uniref:DNA-binding FadR family transcriptional regulator n=1 Tax=Umezawaea tangerina TaxID=84725 RepID=A0A2T0TGA5_9PSEU|nr:FCD domain-containing protein [Umezawaea tangerina]PRY44716.1 DNA-binding FadR family transcriptional regulator [Umezawaea tangerina]
MNPLRDRAGSGLHARVVDALGSRIADGGIPPGSVLSTEAIERDHGVSRSVVREVVRTLTGLGMVEARQRVGTTVLPVSSWDLLDPRVIAWRDEGPDALRQLDELITLREALEPVAAQRAAANDDGSTAAALREHLTRMEAAFRATDPRGFAAADTAFHEALLRGARNDVLSQLVQTVLATLHARYSGHRLFSDDTAASLERHHDLVDAVASGDAARAETVSRALVRAARVEVLGDDKGKH